MERVWSGTVVEEGNLTVTICQLPGVFDDDAHKPAYIQTIAWHGYRLIADVNEVELQNGRILEYYSLNGKQISVLYWSAGLYGMQSW